MKKPARSHPRRSLGDRCAGFTLTEILVVITILVTLAAISMIGVKRLRFGAAKAATTNQMRQIGVAALAWGADNNYGEPFYVANGSGDYCDESFPGLNPALSAGNPAAMLYRTEDPEQGYIADHEVFFSPLVNFRPPERKDYKPREAGTANPWGSYVWYYPFTTEKSARQAEASGQWLGGVRVKPTLENRLLMMTDFSRGQAVWDNFYLALLVEGNVRELSRGEVPARPAQ
ncbi:MAG: type II secretion system protein [Akkermansiaceae bacterium]|nr:type II secretion system protein [Akkermansiaceae bacterium]